MNRLNSDVRRSLIARRKNAVGDQLNYYIVDCGINATKRAQTLAIIDETVGQLKEVRCFGILIAIGKMVDYFELLVFFILIFLDGRDVSSQCRRKRSSLSDGMWCGTSSHLHFDGLHDRTEVVFGHYWLANMRLHLYSSVYIY